MTSNFISLLNSTTQPLDAFEIFTGSWENVLQYQSITITGITDQDCSLFAEFSSDGITTLSSEQLCSTSLIGSHQIQAKASNFRIRIINDAITQTYLIIQSILNITNKLPISVLSDPIDNYSDTIITRSVLVCEDSNLSYQNVGITLNKELLTNTLASDRQMRAVWQSSIITTDTYTMLIDLDGGPHIQTSFVSIGNISISCNFSQQNSECYIRIGVITRVDAIDADISYLIGVPFACANANTALYFINNYQPSAVQFKVSGGVLVAVASNDFETTAVINTGTTLQKPGNGLTATPAVGDVIIKFESISGNFVSGVSCVYHSDD